MSEPQFRQHDIVKYGDRLYKVMDVISSGGYFLEDCIHGINTIAETGLTLQSRPENPPPTRPVSIQSALSYEEKSKNFDAYINELLSPMKKNTSS